MNALFKAHYKFVIGARISLKFIQDQLKAERPGFERRENYSSATGLFIKSQTMDWAYEETKMRSGEVVAEPRRMYVHIYYNDQLAMDEKLRFNKMLDALEEELISDKHKEGHEKGYTKYFDASATPVRGVRIKPKQAAIDAARKTSAFSYSCQTG